MKRKTILILLPCLLILAIALCGCGSKAAEPEVTPEPAATAVPAEPTPAGPDLRSLQGFYTEELSHRGRMVMTASDEQHASFVIDWSNSAFDSYHWEMNGVYDAEQQAVVYSDAVLIDQVFDEQGRESDTILYTQGTGSFAIADGKLVWTENADNRPEPSTFIFEMTLDAYQRYQEAQPTAEPAPTPTPKPTPTPRPTVPPTITKDPVGETVQEGDSCLFVAKEEGAVTAVWHFLSPDGKIDIEYSAASKQFPPLEVYGGDTGTITLTEIPLSLNKWKVYCRFTNEYGISDTKTAKILVTVKPTPTPKPTKAPKPTVEPTVEPTLTPSLGPVVNEWVETTSLQEAIDGSGVNFDPPQAMSVLGDLRFKTYRYRTGTIEVIHTDKFDMDDHVLTIRKSTANAGESLLGDYNSYSATWDLSIKGLTVHCKGDGETANNVWFDGGGAHYAILFRPGHEGSGLTPDDINSLVNGMQ